MCDCFHARVYVHSAITLTATLALTLCYLDVIDSMSLSFNPTYRIERCLLFWARVASSRKCRDRLGTRKKFRVNRPDFQHSIPPCTGCKIGRPAFGLFGTFSQLCTGTSHITYYTAHLLTQQSTTGTVTFASRLNRPWWVCWRSHFPSNCNLKIYSFIWITNIDISSRRLSSELLLLRY